MKGTLRKWLRAIGRGPSPDPYAVLVARRGLRIHNRSAAAAERYEATQLALRRATEAKDG
jgi:hypothetical protein